MNKSPSSPSNGTISAINTPSSPNIDVKNEGVSTTRQPRAQEALTPNILDQPKGSNKDTSSKREGTRFEIIIHETPELVRDFILEDTEEIGTSPFERHTIEVS